MLYRQSPHTGDCLFLRIIYNFDVNIDVFRFELRYSIGYRVDI